MMHCLFLSKVKLSIINKPKCLNGYFFVSYIYIIIVCYTQY